MSGTRKLKDDKRRARGLKSRFNARGSTGMEKTALLIALGMLGAFAVANPGATWRSLTSLAGTAPVEAEDRSNARVSALTRVERQNSMKLRVQQRDARRSGTVKEFLARKRHSRDAMPMSDPPSLSAAVAELYSEHATVPRQRNLR
mgnify:CR=1 FL=1